MPFGLGVFETGLILAVLVGIPVTVVVLLIRSQTRGTGEDRPASPAATPQLTAEIDAARRRLEELEAKLARTEGKVTSTESLLDERRKGR
jgi:hypothetical protein